MKVDLKTQVTNIDGQPFKDVSGIETTVENAIVSCLRKDWPDEVLSFEQKCDRYMLMRKVKGMDEVELDSEEIEVIKKCAGKMFIPEACGALNQALGG